LKLFTFVSIEKNKLITLMNYRFSVFCLSSMFMPLILLVFSSQIKLIASDGKWTSPSLNVEISYTVREATSPLRDRNSKYFTIVYLENLGFDKLGGNPNETDVQWLLTQGYRVIELDYNHNAKAISPAINKDIIAINDDLSDGAFGEAKNCSQYRSYILFEGYRIARDVSFFKDDPTVYNSSDQYTQGDSLYMDIIYPANAKDSVPVVLSFSYSNSYHGNAHQRLFLGYTLAPFNDSFLEGAPARGMAWAIADHPKYCSWGGGKPIGGANDTYKSYQTNPDAARKVRSAVRTLRTKGTELGLSGKIGIYGFSRGSDAGSMAVGNKVDSIIDTVGLNIGVSDDVQVAALGPGVFDFTQIYNNIDDGDGNLETRCPWAWGDLSTNRALWQTMGSAYYADDSTTSPVLFFYNTSDSYYYLDQAVHFKDKLDSLGVPTSSLINYGTGHSVPQTDTSLTQLYNFFVQYLIPPTLHFKPDTTPQINSAGKISTYRTDAVFFPNPAKDMIAFKFKLEKSSTVKFMLCNISGQIVYTQEKQFLESGQHSETIDLRSLNVAPGIYFANAIMGDRYLGWKFIKTD
jgi:hypothetical protein